MRLGLKKKEVRTGYTLEPLTPVSTFKLQGISPKAKHNSVTVGLSRPSLSVSASAEA